MSTKPSRRWVISDTHLGHRNILTYYPVRLTFCQDAPSDKSPTQDMDNAIVDRWNKVVGRGDVVYHLGDVAFLKDHEYFKELIGRLNGEKHLIIGSHDKQPKMFYLELGFASAQDRLVIDRNVLLEHERVEPLPRGVRLQIHGHEHSRMRLKPSERHVCVSVELTGMAPVDLDEIMADHGLGRIKRKEQR